MSKKSRHADLTGMLLRGEAARRHFFGAKGEHGGKPSTGATTAGASKAARPAKASSLAREQMDIENLQMTDPRRYGLPETQQKLDRIIEARLKAREIDERGEPIRAKAPSNDGEGA